MAFIYFYVINNSARVDIEAIFRKALYSYHGVPSSYFFYLPQA